MNLPEATILPNHVVGAMSSYPVEIYYVMAKFLN
jgi:hypothetical protein